jgi:hypothetical protein
MIEECGTATKRTNMQHTHDPHHNGEAGMPNVKATELETTMLETTEPRSRQTPLLGNSKARPQQQASHSLLALIGAGAPDFGSAEQVDAFIREERQSWSS